MLTRGPSRRPRAAGFSLIEILIALAIASLLIGLAVPSSFDAVRRARRLDAIVAVHELQMEQSRWRSRHGRYATLEELGRAGQTSNELYRLEVSEVDARGYRLTAIAQRSQQGDGRCRVLQMVVEGGDTRYASGVDERADNAPADDRRCWGRPA